jgi:hypothetical protein
MESWDKTNQQVMSYQLLWKTVLDLNPSPFPSRAELSSWQTADGKDRGCICEDKEMQMCAVLAHGRWRTCHARGISHAPGCSGMHASAKEPDRAHPTVYTPTEAVSGPPTKGTTDLLQVKRVLS